MVFERHTRPNRSPLGAFPSMIDHASLDVTSLDAGKLLPGVSIPMVVGETSIHAFRSFESLPVDGLSKAARTRLYRSFADVVRSLELIHGHKQACGHLTLRSFHNRGTPAEPSATLWIDPNAVYDVHAGDPDAMYLTEARLSHGRAAKPSDDWYAMGVVLAEIALGTSAVATIWQLGRQDGQFTEKLLKNLKRSRGCRAIKRTAIELIQRSQTDEIDAAKIANRIEGADKHSRLAWWSALLNAIGLVGIVVGAYAAKQQQHEHEQTLQALEGEVDRFAKRIEVLKGEAIARQAAPLPPPQPAVAPPPIDQQAQARRRWVDQVAGRSLGEAIELAIDGSPQAWRTRLENVSVMQGQPQWRAFDTTLRLRVQRLVDEPWETSHYDIVVARIDALNEAHSRWSTWARSSKSLDQVKEQHALMASGRVKDFLGDWLAEAIEIRDFELSVREVRQATEGEQEKRSGPHVVGFETSSMSLSEKWTWPETAESEARIRLPVDEFRAGDTLRFWLQQDGTLWNSTVIDHTFSSPLLIWQLAKGLRLDDSASEYSVALETDRAYGPPVKLERIVSGKARSATVTDQPLGQKVIDPIDSLPL